MTTQARLRRGFHRFTLGRFRGLRTLASAFLHLDIVEDLSYPAAFILSELAVFVPVIGYFFIGELVGQSDFVGDDYFTYAAIGIAVSVMLQAALSGFGGALQRSQNRGQFEMLLTGPIPWLYLPTAMNLWRTMLGAINGALILVFAVLLGSTFVPSGLPQFAILVVLGIGASTAIGILAASLLVVSKRSQPFVTIYGLAASLLGGALFSIDQLPQWLRWVSFLIPHTYVINSARAVLMPDPGSFLIPFGVAAIALLVFNVAFLSLGLWLFSRSLQFARREGILGGY